MRQWQWWQPWSGSETESTYSVIRTVVGTWAFIEVHGDGGRYQVLQSNCCRVEDTSVDHLMLIIDHNIEYHLLQIYILKAHSNSLLILPIHIATWVNHSSTTIASLPASSASPEPSYMNQTGRILGNTSHNA